MPLLDSFTVDHTIMPAPAVRKAKVMKTPCGDNITVFDLRFYKPNVDKMDGRGIHTLEHLFAGFMRDHLNSKNVEIIDLSPMGCRTGFYMSVIGTPNEKRVAKAWKEAMQDVLKVKSKKEIPELNIYQCGTYKMHSLKKCKKIASDILSHKIGVMDNEKLKLSKRNSKRLTSMLLQVPMNSKEVQEAQITPVLEAKVWAQLRIEEGELVEVVHSDTYDGFENWSEAVVVQSDGEPVMDFINMSMIVLVAHTQKTIDDIVEAYLFRELHDLAY